MTDEKLTEAVEVAIHDTWHRPGTIKDVALAAIDAMRKHEGWQDISTAPKDRTEILIYVPGTYYCPYFVVRWNPYKFGGIWQLAAGLEVIGKDLPTHWQPLPTPPAAKGESRG